MKRFIFLLLLVLVTHMAWAELSLQVEASTVQMGQTFRLLLTKDNLQPGGIPDLTPLQTDFKIVGTERSTHYSIINGQASSISQWTVLLTAKRRGIFTIPPIHLGQEQTQPLRIEVTAAQTTLPSSDAVDPEKDVMLVTTVSHTEPYVNEQVIYTVKLFNSRRLLDASFEGPTIDNALLIPLGDGKRYQTAQSGRIYSVEEQQYAIFPQKSGELTVVSPSFTALIYEDVPRQVTVKAAPTQLKVKSAPSQINKTEWIPAKQITLSEVYEPKETTFTQGSTLVRSVTLQALGLPAQLLPVLPFSSTNEVSVYPEKPQENNQLKQGDLLGSTTVKVTYLLNKSGKITLPSLQLRWFNTQTNKEDIAVLPPSVVNVTAALPSSPSLPSDKPLSTAVKDSIPVDPGRNTALAATNVLAWGLAGVFAVAWLMTLLLWWRRRQPSAKQNKWRWKQLQQACLSNQPELARKALLQWAHDQWRDLAVLNLAEITQLTQDIKLNHQINVLAKALYHTTNQPWHGEELWRCLSTFQEKQYTKKSKPNPLPPINPD